MADSTVHPLLATLPERLREHPDPVAVQRRVETLARLPRTVLESLETSGAEVNTLAALVTLGEAPVTVALRLGDALPPALDLTRDPLDPLPADLATARDQAWLGIALREQTGVWTVERSAAAYATLADTLTARVLNTLAPSSAPAPLLFALGKWGSGELNAASDIDPVFLAPAGMPPGEGDRIVRRWTQQLSGTRDRRIYEIDLRLRPEGDAGPLAWALSECERYFLQRAAPWERVAWLRARPVAGDPPAWFHDMLAHFLFAMGGDVHERIRIVAANLDTIHRSARPRDLKRQPGGIRDVEFLVAALQLATGRQDPELRHGSMPALLRRLGHKHLLAPQDARALVESYLFHRRLEHALQVDRGGARFIVPDPGSPGHHSLAYTLGLDPDRLEDEWRQHRARILDGVRKVLPVNLSRSAPAAPALDPQADSERSDPVAITENKRNRTILNRLSGKWGPASTLFDVAKLSGAPGADDALARLEASVNAYGGPEAWAAAFAGRDAVLNDITRLLLHGRRVVEEANQRPYLWEKIGGKAYPMPEPASPADLNRQLGDLTFSLGEAFLAGAVTAQDLTATWTRAVDRIADFLARGDLGGDSSSPPIALLASGKWGGQELAPDGDLDLLYVCDDSEQSRTAAGVRAAAAFLTTLSLGGRLTPDARLRPEGSGSPLCVTVSRLESYLATRAAPWERMALVRARYVAGDRTAGPAAQRVLREFSSTPPSPGDLPALHAARKKASQAARARRDTVRIKKAAGGMMDYEFAATFAFWRMRVPPRDIWAGSLFDRMRHLDQHDDLGEDRWSEAVQAYEELRRWELLQSFSSAHRRGDVPVEGEEGERFAHAAGMSVEEVKHRWEEISSLGRALYEETAAELDEALSRL